MGLRYVDKKIKKKVIDRDKVCRVCGREESLYLHHRIRVGQIRIDELWNFLSVCKVCHTNIHNNVAWSVKKGFIIVGFLHFDRLVGDKEGFTEVFIDKCRMIPDDIVNEVKEWMILRTN